MIEWQPRKGSIDGCIELHSPKVLQYSKSYSRKLCPILALEDKLDTEGFTGVKHFVTHVPFGDTVYDCRQPCRLYLQCVLSMPTVFAGGGLTFRSKRKATYYRAILAGHFNIEHNLADTEYAKALRIKDEDKDVVKALDAKPPAN